VTFPEQMYQVAITEILVPDFFYSYDGFFRSYAGRFTKKVLFHPESHKRTFSAVTMDFGTFSTLMMEFSTVELSIFEKFVLIPFHSYDGNPKGSPSFRACSYWQTAAR